MTKYIPTVILLLAKVKEVFEKYGKYVGFVPAPEALGEVNDGTMLLAEMEASVKKLNQLLEAK